MIKINECMDISQTSSYSFLSISLTLMFANNETLVRPSLMFGFIVISIGLYSTLDNSHEINQIAAAAAATLPSIFVFDDDETQFYFDPIKYKPHNLDLKNVVFTLNRKTNFMIDGVAILSRNEHKHKVSSFFKFKRYQYETMKNSTLSCFLFGGQTLRERVNDIQRFDQVQ
ncbi:hypothetical protein BLOT_012978 [Blomia tropicalis]|nr:hypothetical protein BLOT_012978 [Blomia tropicalis]